MLRRFFSRFGEAFRKGDLFLLLLCVVTSAFGCLIVASATNASNTGPMRYVLVQIGASVAGVVLYVLISMFNMEYLAERRRILTLITLFLIFLLVPFGKTVNGNRSWLDFSFLPFDIQPAEICKIFFIVILASVMASHQSRISSPRSVFHMAAHLVLVFGLNYVISGDMGVSLIFAFIFFGMAWSGGVGMVWFGIVVGAAILLLPTAWNMLPDDNYMKTRIAVLFDPSLDPNGTGARYQTVRALRSLTGGGLTGQGLFQGNRTQTNGALFAQHTDFIYCVIGEELGFVGCAVVLTMLCVIIGRCIWVGLKSPEIMRRLTCFGVASAMIFQVVVNVGMCIGVMPVIGLTLPFISYGGSSVIAVYMMLGLVSGVYAHPTPTSQERYIHAPIQSIQ